MKNHFLTLAVLALAFCSCSKPIPKADYQVIPLPQTITEQVGAPFVLNNGSTVYLEEGTDPKILPLLQEYVLEATGIQLQQTQTPGTAAIRLSLGLSSQNPDAYRMTVTPQGIDIQGASGSGLFYGVQTLRKSLPLRANDIGHIALKKVSFPAVTIEDAPRFAYRGMMLDICRHFYGPEEIKEYIDILALHNINRLHLHVTEDQGWRIEIKKHPILTEKGAVRAQTMVGKNFDKYDGTPYGGYLTQEEIRDLVAYAQDRHITIIPEIDMPGHMQAALACYPELGCTGGPYKVREQWGISTDVLCAGNPKSLQFVKEVLDEVMELFPSEYIHIGGDECPKERWEACPECQARIKALGLKPDARHTEEQLLQSWFMSEVEGYLNQHGRRIIGWDEILEGGATPDATVMAWRDDGIANATAAAQQGHDVILTPTSYLYFDYYQSTAKDEPLAIGGLNTVGHVYSYEPCPVEMAPEVKEHILGVQANEWTEYIPDSDYLQYMILPRLDALCEVQWTQPERKDYGSFVKRLDKMFSFYELYGYTYARHVHGVTADYAYDPAEGQMIVSLEAAPGGIIRYTLDGTRPTAESPVYSVPMLLTKDTPLQAIAFFGKKEGPLFHDELVVRKDIEAAELLTQPHPSYGSKGAVTLVDGFLGEDNFKRGSWLGYCDDSLVALLTFREL